MTSALCVSLCVCVVFVRACACACLIFDAFQLSSQFVEFHKTGCKNATIPQPMVFNFLRSVITTWRMCEFVRRKRDKRQPHFFVDSMIPFWKEIMIQIIHSLHTLHTSCTSIYTEEKMRRNKDYLPVAYYIWVIETKQIVMTVNSSAISHFSSHWALVFLA